MSAIQGTLGSHPRPFPNHYIHVLPHISQDEHNSFHAVDSESLEAIMVAKGGTAL